MAVPQTTTLWTGLLSLVLLYFFFVHIHPHDELIRFMLVVSHKVDTNSSAYDLRLPVKTRMTDPFLLFVGYPISFVFLDIMGLKHLPDLISPDGISSVHPLLAFAAVYFLLTSVTSPKVSVTPSSPALKDDVSCTHPADIEEPPLKESNTPRDSKDRALTYTVVSYAETDVMPIRMRLAALCLAGRQVLDTMDGSLARVHQRMGIKHWSSGLAPGPLIDMATDTLGVFVFFVAIHIHFSARRPVLTYSVSGGRTPLHVRLWHRASAFYYAHGLSPASTSKLTCAFAFLMVAVRGLFWEYYIPVFEDIFDHPANAAAPALEASIEVQLVYFLWGLSCIDALLFYFIIALLANRLWTLICFYAYAGWVWTAVVVGFTSVVRWHVVAILAASGASPG